jgi:opacity protein-like surface antigen
VACQVADRTVPTTVKTGRARGHFFARRLGGGQVSQSQVRVADDRVGIGLFGLRGGAGAAFLVWKRIRVEGGYRYMRLFGDAKTNINRAHVAAGWTF